MREYQTRVLLIMVRKKLTGLKKSKNTTKNSKNVRGALKNVKEDLKVANVHETRGSQKPFCGQLYSGGLASSGRIKTKITVHGPNMGSHSRR